MYKIFRIWYACMSMDRYRNVDVGKIVPLLLWLCAFLHTENVFIWFLRANISHVIIFAWLPTFPSAGYLIPCCYLRKNFSCTEWIILTYQTTTATAQMKYVSRSSLITFKYFPIFIRMFGLCYENTSSIQIFQLSS